MNLKERKALPLDIQGNKCFFSGRPITVKNSTHLKFPSTEKEAKIFDKDGNAGMVCHPEHLGVEALISKVVIDDIVEQAEEKGITRHEVIDKFIVKAAH